MAFTVPTLDELHDFLVAMLKALFPAMDVSRTSFPALFARVLAAAATDNHAHVVATMNDLLPDTAEGEMLDRWGEIAGIVRKGATPARKANALRLVNNSGSNEGVTIGQLLTHAGSQLAFAINENATILAGTTQDVDVVAVDTGSATRLEAGEELTFVTPPANIEEVAVLVLDLDEDGDDDESDGDYRRRILARFSTPPLGGAQNDYVTWSLQVTGIDAAYAYPNRAGLGTVDVAALHAGTGTARILSPAEVVELQAHLDEERPVHATVRVLEVQAQDVSVAVRVLDTGEEAYAWDWIDETPLVVSSWNAPTRQLDFTGDRPDTMQAGHFLVLAKLDGTGDGAPIEIESLVGADAVILAEAPSATPVNMDLVYSSGALTVPVRAAILAHINGLGTANPDSALYGEWEGSLRLAALYREVTLVPGVRDVTVDVPAATVDATDPPFPGDAEINLLVPARVLVRRRW